MKRLLVGCWIAACAALGVLIGISVRAENAHALWQIVHDRCVPDQEQHAIAKPCAIVDQGRGFAVLKDLHGPEQFLLIPTTRVSGIESPRAREAGAPNYFAEAWAQRSLVEARLHRPLPREDFALAVNSRSGRSQDQLHIHVDCISRPVHDALVAEINSVGGHWTNLPTPLAGHHYRAILIDKAELGAVNPFRLLAASLADPDHAMGWHTLVLVGAGSLTHPGFLLLDDAASLRHLDHAAGEELQDHQCAIANAQTTGQTNAQTTGQ